MTHTDRQSSCWWFKVTHQLYTGNKVAWWKDVLFFKARGFIKGGGEAKKIDKQQRFVWYKSEWSVQPDHTPFGRLVWTYWQCYRERLYQFARFLRNKDTDYKITSTHILTWWPTLGHGATKLACMHTRTPNTGATVRNAAHLVKAGDRSLWCITREDVEVSGEPGVLMCWLYKQNVQRASLLSFKGETTTCLQWITLCRILSFIYLFIFSKNWQKTTGRQSKRTREKNDSKTTKTPHKPSVILPVQHKVDLQPNNVTC